MFLEISLITLKAAFALHFYKIQMQYRPNDSRSDKFFEQTWFYNWIHFLAQLATPKLIIGQYISTP